jgi:hypothetical protein
LVSKQTDPVLATPSSWFSFDPSSISAKQRPGLKPPLPVTVTHDVIVPTGDGEVSSFEDVTDAIASCDGLPGRTEGVILYAITFEKDIVADEEHILEDVESEAGRVAVDVEGLDAVIDKVFIKGGVEGEGTADLVDGVIAVDVYLGSKEFPVKV